MGWDGTPLLSAPPGAEPLSVAAPVPEVLFCVDHTKSKMSGGVCRRQHGNPWPVPGRLP